PGERHEGALGLDGPNREATVEVGHERPEEVLVGRLVALDVGRAQLLGQPSLNRSERSFAPSTRLWRAGENLADSKGLQRARNLAVLLYVWPLCSDGGVAKVAPSICVEFAEASLGPEPLVQGREGRSSSFLLDEACEEDPSVGIVEHDDEILHRQVRDPAVLGRVEWQQQADHRPALALAAVLAPARGPLRQTVCLQDGACQRVGQLQAVLLRRELVEVADRKVGVDLALESAQLLYRGCPESLVTAPPTH